jgi:hypothetical protein
MTKPVESVVKAALEKNGRAAKLLAAVEYGWARSKLHPDTLKFRRKTTRASIMWECSVEKAVELLGSDVHIEDHHDTVSFIFDQRILVRMKKAGTTLRTANYPTLLAGLFHEPAKDLFGFDEMQRVEAVHVLNQYGTDIAWVGIVARDGGKVIWNFELADVKPMTLRPARAKKSTATLAKLKGVAAAADKKKKSGE